MSFGNTFASFQNRFEDNNEEIVKAVSIKLFSAIILASPVDDGRFRSNWFPANAVPSNMLIDGELPAQITINNAARFVQTSQAMTFTLTNNLPYAQTIEFGGYSDGPNTIGGFSKQAPQGVVRVNAARFERLITAEARRVGA